MPNELLLDIKKLADIEGDEEKTLRDLFDSFNIDSESPLYGLMSSSAKASGKLSRVTFNAAVKPILSTFASPTSSVIYPAVKSYLKVFHRNLRKIGSADAITNPTVFRSIFSIFPEVAQRVLDRNGPLFKEEAFEFVIEPLFNRVKPTNFSKPPKSHRELAETLSKSLKAGFIIG